MIDHIKHIAFQFYKDFVKDYIQTKGKHNVRAMKKRIRSIPHFESGPQTIFFGGNMF